jgi:hypothetical protein
MMDIGDHIRFPATGCRGLVVKITEYNSIVYVHVLCGPDADGEHGGEILAFPRNHLATVAEIL